jgi:hypothetical protein
LEEAPKRAVTDRQATLGEFDMEFLKGHVPACLENRENCRRMGLDHMHLSIAPERTGLQSAERPIECRQRLTLAALTLNRSAA